jgi:S-DNA-T family DNA segregation ATPase FtsK/SpoIIIE
MCHLIPPWIKVMEQVDMVLGDGARDRGAACELISTDPATGAGVAFARLEADPDPVRVRAGWVTDENIRAMAAACVDDTAPLAIEVAA